MERQKRRGPQSFPSKGRNLGGGRSLGRTLLHPLIRWNKELSLQGIPCLLDGCQLWTDPTKCLSRPDISLLLRVEAPAASRESLGRQQGAVLAAPPQRRKELRPARYVDERGQRLRNQALGVILTSPARWRRVTFIAPLHSEGDRSMGRSLP